MFSRLNWRPEGRGRTSSGDIFFFSFFISPFFIPQRFINLRPIYSRTTLEPIDHNSVLSITSLLHRKTKKKTTTAWELISEEENGLTGLTHVCAEKKPPEKKCHHLFTSHEYNSISNGHKVHLIIVPGSSRREKRISNLR